MTRKIRDSDGEDVCAGDMITFSYGIPPVRVEAHVIERKGRLIVLTPGHNPEECPLHGLRHYIGEFWKLPQRKEEAASCGAA